MNADGTVTLTRDALDDGSGTGCPILRRRPRQGEKTPVTGSERVLAAPGLLRCETRGKALTAAEAKCGKYTAASATPCQARQRNMQDPQANDKTFGKPFVKLTRETVHYMEDR